MTRASRATSHRGVLAAAPHDRPGATLRKKKPYKIVLEAITQEKRKLKSSLTYHDAAPPGFGYIPVGHPEITEWCKEQCRQRNLDVHIVSAKPRTKAFFDPEKISSHVHRIGHHFPIEIIKLACSKFGYRYDEGGLRRIRGSPVYGPAYVERGIANYEQRQALHGKPVTDTEHKEHIRGAIREIFPKIPEADLTSIVNHAFEEGTDRVGNAKELSLARRVQLAVVAHIRHTYTEYDNILKHKTGTWTEARQQVEHVSLAKLKEWRDETDEASNELEETFREVIVLDDDEDTSDDESPSAPNTREPSMEIVSSRATARDLQPELVDRMRAYDPYMSRASRRTIVLRPMPTYSPRQSLVSSPSRSHYPLQASRGDVRALPPSSTVGREPSRAQAEMYRSNGELTQYPRRPLERSLIADDGIGRPGAMTPQEPAAIVGQQVMRDSAGRLFTLQPIDSARDLRSPAYSYHANSPYETSRSPYSNPISYGHGHSRSLGRQAMGPVQYQEPPPQRSRPRLTPSSRRTSDQDMVLPSVEREPEPPAQKRKSLPYSAYEDYPPTAYEDYPGHTSKRLRPAQDVQPRHQGSHMISNQAQPAYNSGNDVYEVARPRAAPADHAYYPMPPRRSPLHDPRGAYREVVVPHSPRAYVPGCDGTPLHDRRVLPGNERGAMSGPATRYETRAGLYVRDSGSNGYYTTR
ncbi:hypothetical protein PMIN07_012424 [Paraphaeosphaeria minitans]